MSGMLTEALGRGHETRFFDSFVVGWWLGLRRHVSMDQASRRLLELVLGLGFGLFLFDWHPSVLGVFHQRSQLSYMTNCFP